MNCPHCDQKVRVREEFYGKRVKCPSCEERFIVDPETEEALPVGDEAAVVEEERPTRKRRAAPEADENEKYEERPKPKRRPGAEEPEDEPEEQPRRKRRPPRTEEQDEQPSDLSEPEEELEPLARGSKAGWRKVRTGLTLMLVAAAVSFGLLLLAFLGGAIIGGMSAGVRGKPDLGAAQTFGAVVGILIVLVGNGLGLTGLWLCAQVPPKTGARGLALGAFCLGVLTLVLGLLRGVMLLANGAPAAGAANQEAGLATSQILAAVLALLGTTNGVLFLLFLRAVALRLRRDSLATTAVVATAILVLAGLLTAVSNLLVQTSAAPGAPANAANGVILIAASCSMIVLGLACLILSLVVLVKVRAAVGEKAGF